VRVALVCGVIMGGVADAMPAPGVVSYRTRTMSASADGVGALGGTNTVVSVTATRRGPLRIDVGRRAVKTSRSVAAAGVAKWDGVAGVRDARVAVTGAASTTATPSSRSSVAADSTTTLSSRPVVMRADLATLSVTPAAVEDGPTPPAAARTVS